MGNKATIICIMDKSGSMGVTKKELSKKYFHMFKGLIEGRYDDVECKFIGHTTEGEQVDTISELVNKTKSGGTYLSSGANLALDIIEKEINPFENDIYTMIFSDGDNWGEDNDAFIKAVNKLCKKCVSVQFTEVRLATYATSILTRLNAETTSDNFTYNKISKKEDIKTIVMKMMGEEFKDNEFVKIRERDRCRLTRDIVKIERIGKTTVVELADGTRGFFCTCMKSDTYDEELGFKIAKIRAELSQKRMN